MKHLLKMNDLTREELYHILDVAVELKAAQKAGGTPPLLAGKSVALMFSKTSTRTRTSFEVGVFQLGGLGSYMNAATELQASRGEPLRDTARVLGRYYDCIVWRTYRQRDLEELARLRRGTGHQRPDRLRPPLPGAGRPDDHPGAPRPPGGAEALLCGGRQQHGQQPDRRGAPGRDAGDLRLPARLPPRGRRAGLCPALRPGVPAAGRPPGGGPGCRRGGHRRLEQRRRRGGRAPDAGLPGLPADRRPAGGRKARLHGPALPARPPGRGNLQRRL